MKLIATILTALIVSLLFFMDRKPQIKNSRALWIPQLWLLIIASRPVSYWFGGDGGLTQTSQFTDSSPIDAIIFGILLVAGLQVINLRWQRVQKLLSNNLPILIYFVYCLLSVMWSDEAMVGAKRWVKSLGDLVMIFIVLTDENPLTATRRIFMRAAYILLPVSVLLIFYYPSLGSFYILRDHMMMYTGVTTFKNMLGITCQICGLTCLWMLTNAMEKEASQYRIRQMVTSALLMITALWLIRKADSMTSLSCLLLAGTSLVFLQRRWVHRSSYYPHVLVMGAVSVAAVGLFLDSMGGVLHALGRSSNLTGRTEIWRVVLSIPINPIVGTGFESFWMGARLQAVWDMSARGLQEAHNGFIEVYLNLGWVGLAIVASLIVSGYVNAYLIYRRNKQAGAFRLAIWVAVMAFSLTEAGFRMMSTSWFAFLFVVCRLTQSEVADGQDYKPSSAHSPLYGLKTMH